MACIYLDCFISFSDAMNELATVSDFLYQGKFEKKVVVAKYV